jgi:hypothetical protein
MRAAHGPEREPDCYHEVMVLAILLLIVVLPQFAGYAATRLSRRAGWVEWLAAAVASHTAIWYVACGSRVPPPPPPGAYRCGLGPMICWGLLVAGLAVHIVLGGVLAKVFVRPEPPVAPPVPKP